MAALLGFLGTPLLLLSWKPATEGERKAQPASSQPRPEESVDLDLGELGQIYLPLTHAAGEGNRVDVKNLPYATYIPSHELNAEAGPNLRQMQSLLSNTTPPWGHQSLIAELAVDSDPIRARPRSHARDYDPGDINTLDPKTLKALLASQN